MRMPRKLASTLHASKPNELLLFDFLYIGPGEGGMLYILILKSDMSNYLRLVPCTAADGPNAMKA
jgi:hypothetical protein